MLLVGIDVKMLAAARGLVRDGLRRQVDFHQRPGVRKDTVEQLAEKIRADHDRQHEVVQLIVLVDVRKEAADHHAEAVARNGPGGVFATAARPEILACHEDLPAVLGIVQHKIRIERPVRTVTPVAEEVVAKELLIAGRSLEEAGGNDLVGVYVLQRQGDAGGCQYVEFLFHLDKMKN